jgi:hypothetical protein
MSAGQSTASPVTSSRDATAEADTVFDPDDDGMIG